MENKPTFPKQWNGGKPTVKPPEKKPRKACLLVALIIILALAGGAGYYYLRTADRGRTEITPARP